jgi:hypothetical protein
MLAVRVRKDMENKIVSIEKIVVVFDICSSSNIIEDLTLTGNLASYKTLLKLMDSFIRANASAQKYLCYKFLGDGWILLFHTATSGENILHYLGRLCKVYSLRFKHTVENHLEQIPDIVGITFGIEKGKLVYTVLNNKIEYFGRAINIACRLQGAIKDNDRSPQYKALMSNHVYNTYFRNIQSINKYKPLKAVRKLRNIRGSDNYNCYKISFQKEAVS